MARGLKPGFYRRGKVIWTRDPVSGERTSTRCTDPKAAELWKAERERLAANPNYAASTKATVGRWVLKTMEHKAGSRAGGTLHMYKVKLGHVVRLFGAEAPLSTITPGAVDEYVRSRSKEGASNSTIKREFTCLVQMLKLAKRAGEFAGDLSQLLPVGFSAKYEPTKRILRREDLAALLAALRNDTERAWLCLALSTGADVGDIERALPEDYDPVHKVFRVRGTKTVVRDAGVPILPLFEDLFAFALPRLPISWPRASKGIGEACKRAKLPHLSPKDIRRTAASWLIAAGVDQSLVSRFMRHRNDTMVRMVYGQLQPQELGRLIQAQSGTEKAQFSENTRGPLAELADAGDLKGHSADSISANLRRIARLKRPKQASPGTVVSTETAHSPAAYALAFAAERLLSVAGGSRV
jgi:integrase